MRKIYKVNPSYTIFDMIPESTLPDTVFRAGISYAHLTKKVGLVHIPFNGVITINDAVAITEHLRDFLAERGRHFNVADVGRYDERRIRELHGVDDRTPYCAFRIAPAFIATPDTGLIPSMDMQVAGPHFPRETPTLNNALLRAYAETLGWKPSP